MEKDLNKALQDSSLALILTNHSEFKQFKDADFDSMENKVIFDTKNVVETSFEDTQYFNYGNLFESVKK